MPVQSEKVQMKDIRRRVIPRKIPEDERKIIGCWLIEQLGSEIPLCVTDLAKEKGVTASYLKYWFSVTCKEITSRWKEYVKTQSELQRADQAKYIEAVIADLISRNIYPSRRRVSEIIRSKGMSLAKPHHLRAYRLIMSN